MMQFAQLSTAELTQCSVPTIVGSARLGLTRDPSCLCLCFTLWTSFSCTHRIYGVTHTHTYIHSLATYRRHTGDHESKTNKSRPLYISPLSWSTLLLKSLNLPVTLLETTRNERIAAKLTKWLAPVYFSTSPLEPEPLYISPPSCFRTCLP